MPDDDDQADGSWGRPDGGLDPADYLADDATDATEVDDPSPDIEPASGDPMAPGESVAAVDEDDAVEPNEPG